MPSTAAAMPVSTSGPAVHQRPQHKRNQSSKSAILRALLGSESSNTQGDSKASQKSSTPVLGERNGNMQSPPSSPAKDRKMANPSPSKSLRGNKSGPKKSKSVTNLAAVFGKGNRNSKDVTLAKDNKENDATPSSSPEQSQPPIWAQFATTQRPSIEDEIARYTPQDYRPGSQRNFSGGFGESGQRPMLHKDVRPQNVSRLSSEGIVGAIGRRVSGGRISMDRSSEDSGRRSSQLGRRVSGSSIEQGPIKEKLNVVKRGGKVMAAVAALQGRSKPAVATKAEPELNAKAIDKAFEAVLEARNIPEAQRQKMRTLTLRVKADFVRQDQGTSKAPGASPTGSVGLESQRSANISSGKHAPVEVFNDVDDDDRATKRSRPRSRTFTFSKSDKGGERSPTKKQRAQSRSGLASLVITKDTTRVADVSSTPRTPTGSFGRKSAPPSYPADYIAYLQKNVDPTKAEVGRLHKLRLLLRNETVAWVDSFISLGGMAEIIELYNRIMAIEWREEHEDQLLHETLLCLKGLCTTERAMSELDTYADRLFPKLVGMLFDEEKKGPAEYTTRTIVMNILFNFLASGTTRLDSEALETHARRILAYLGEPVKPEGDQPVDFVLEMHVPRPYKLWCREISNVSKEVFWIFLHNLNVVPLSKSSRDSSNQRIDNNERPASGPSTPFTRKHFPGERPPVPAAPYVGGVEWDATTYIASHLDLLNGLIACIETPAARNALRSEMRACGLEKLLGGTLRTCREKFYSCVHDGLRAWVAAAAEDGWETKDVREGPSEEESPKKSPVKKRKDDTPAPQLQELPVLQGPKLDLGQDDGWLG